MWVIEQATGRDSAGGRQAGSLERLCELGRKVGRGKSETVDRIRGLLSTEKAAEWHSRNFVSCRLAASEVHGEVGVSETKTEKDTRSCTDKASGKRQSSINHGGNLRKANTSDVHDAFGNWRRENRKRYQKEVARFSGKATKFDQQGLEFLRSEQVRGDQYIQKWRNETEKDTRSHAYEASGNHGSSITEKGNLRGFGSSRGTIKRDRFRCKRGSGPEGSKRTFLGYLQRFRGPL